MLNSQANPREIDVAPRLLRPAFLVTNLLALGVEPATVRQRVHRARLMLRGYLSDLVGVKP